ncbi:alpha/beta fold hydrolase [Lentzea tibetensis]|uniref:alpha/beta fold hydrolase n=1 Tax=Lentzea tibetensis TaxID=2591470 RepID=UPI001F3063D6|nr:alpha/beta hydrolase [Lentzea tibetensis]
MGAERIIEANGVELCVETFGDAADPAILLVHGASASMLWWEDELCERIAAGRRYVIRFDNRDTGRSTSYPAGRPGYALDDLVDDAMGVLDALHLPQAHLVGRSMAGATVTRAAEQYPDRVLTLTLVTTSSGEPGLPPMSQDFLTHTANGPDPHEPGQVVDFLVGLMRIYSGGPIDEPAVRELCERDVRRTRDVAACLTNHFLIDFGSPPALARLRTPTLVVHGDRDPVFPLDHGFALLDAIRGSALLVLDNTGHELPQRTWDRFVPALLHHAC